MFAASSWLGLLRVVLRPVPNHHPPTLRLVTLERAVLAGIGGGCQQPLGALAEQQPDGSIRLRAGYAAGGELRWADAQGPDDAALVAQVLRGLGL